MTLILHCQEMSQRNRTNRMSMCLSIPLPILDDNDGEIVDSIMCEEETEDESITNLEKFLSLRKSGEISRITPNTLTNLMKMVEKSPNYSLVILDFRYWYEFEGGCIKGALNIDSPQRFIPQFFEHPKKNTIIIFHCEFSSCRGPDMEYDRSLNKYPNLYYNDIFILDGGYNTFYTQFPDYCDGGYVPMHSEPYKSNGILTAAHSNFKLQVNEFREKMKKDLFHSPKSQYHIPHHQDYGTPHESRKRRKVASPSQIRCP